MSPALQVEPGDYDDAEDPRNRILDGFEASVEAMLVAAEANGCRFQLIQRLQRFMPEPKPDPKSEMPCAPAVKPDPNAELALTIEIGAFARLMRRDLSGVEHKVVAEAKRRAEADLQTLKLARSQ